MLRAANRIEHGMIDKDGRNTVIVIEENQPVKGLPKDVVDSLIASKAIYDDKQPGEQA